MNVAFDQGGRKAYIQGMKDLVADAALRLATRQNWGDVQLIDIAKEAGVSLAELREAIAAKEDVIGLLFERLDRKMLEATTFEGPAKDRLFDVFMARFDAMNAERAAFQSILRSVTFDVPSLCRIVPNAFGSMGWAMNAAGINAQGWKAKPARLALLGVTVSAMKAWMEDNSPDLSAVMAKLDQGLERISGFLA